MKLKTLFASTFCLMLATYGGTTTFASELEQTHGVDVSVETTDNGIINFIDGDKEIGVFFPEEVLDNMPEVHQSIIEERGFIMTQPVNNALKPLATKNFTSEICSVNDSVVFSVTWNYNSSTTFGVKLPVPYNPVAISTTTSGEFIGKYVSKINGAVTPYITNNSTIRTTTYVGQIKMTLN